MERKKTEKGEEDSFQVLKKQDDTEEESIRSKEEISFLVLNCCKSSQKQVS